MVTIWHNPCCSKSRQSLQLLEKRKEEIRIVNYLEDPISEHMLLQVLQFLKMDARQLSRKKETLYKELNLKNKDDKSHLKALLKYPKLIERPIVIRNGQARIGRPAEKILEIL